MVQALLIMPSRCSREAESVLGPHRFVLAVGMSVGLVHFDRCTIIHSCAKLH